MEIQSANNQFVFSYLIAEDLLTIRRSSVSFKIADDRFHLRQRVRNCFTNLYSAVGFYQIYLFISWVDHHLACQ